MTDPQYAAMAVEDLPCKANCSYQRGHDFLPANGHWESCPAHYRDRYAARLQSVATASHKAGAEAMREQAAVVCDINANGRISGVLMKNPDNAAGEPVYMPERDVALINDWAKSLFIVAARRIRALAVPTGEP